MPIDELVLWLMRRWPAPFDGLTVAPPGLWHRGDETLPPMPDRAVGLTWTGGPGERSEGALDVVSFQARVRGRASLPGDDGQRRQDSAEALAAALDLAVLMPAPHEHLGDRTVVLTGRTGGPPAFLRRENARLHLTGNYLLTVSRPQPARRTP